MTTVQEIEAAIQRLGPDQRAQFRSWFDAFDAREWDLQMEQEINSGSLDWLVEEAQLDLASGRCTDR
jgi:hypothetical protein